MDTLIFHVDVNSAFLSWEAVDRLRNRKETLDIRTIPAIIGGSQEKRHGIVLAKSVLCKPYGILTGEPIVSALEKCPNLQIFSPTYGIYVQYSRALMKILESYAPVVEQYSIDEAFCDMSGTQRLYGEPLEFANKLRTEIEERLGFTVNIGVAPNKLLAKMASDFQKPNRVHSLFPDEIPTKMWPLDVSELFFVGKNTSVKLHKLGIHTIGDLAKTSPDILEVHFKKQAHLIWNYANGYDTSPVSNHTSANKGYGNSTTIAYDVTTQSMALQVVLSLCETVSARLRADHAKITVVSISIKDTDLQVVSKQCTLFSPSNVTMEIFDAASKLFQSLWDGRPIRALGVSTSKVSSHDSYQYNLFDMEKYEKQGKVDQAVDQVRERFGNDAIKRACFIKPDQPHVTIDSQKNRPLGRNNHNS